MEGVIRTIQVRVVDPSQFCDGDCKTEIVLVSGVSVSCQSTEVFTPPATLRAYKQ